MKLSLVMDTEHLDTQHTQLLLDDKLVVGVQGFCVEARADVKDVNLSVFLSTAIVDAEIKDMGPLVQELQVAGVRVRFVGGEQGHGQ